MRWDTSSRLAPLGSAFVALSLRAEVDFGGAVEASVQNHSAQAGWQVSGQQSGQRVGNKATIGH